jgi:hypothetical protein
VSYELTFQRLIDGRRQLWFDAFVDPAAQKELYADASDLACSTTGDARRRMRRWPRVNADVRTKGRLARWVGLADVRPLATQEARSQPET